MHCDNQAVVACLSSGTCKSSPVMSLLRKLFLVCAKHNFHVVAYHVPGKSNSIADALSHYNMQVFRQLAPSAQEQPDTAVRPPALD